VPGLPELGPAYWVAVALLLGLLVGSFLNVVIHRLPIMVERAWRKECAELQPEGVAPVAAEPYNLMVPRSACPSCHAPIAPWHNIPVFSWLLLRGRCATCQARISVRYPLIELLCGLLSAAVVWKFGLSAPTLGALLVTWFLIALAAIDIDHQYLLDALTLPLLWGGLLASLAWSPTTATSLPVSPRDAIIGAAGGYLSLWCVYQLFKRCTGKEGMGYGDFKLLAALGAWLGWRMLLPIVMCSAAVGSVVGITLIIAARRGRDVPIPFGPYLAAAGWLAMMWGSPWISAYLGLYGHR
jgi:leader peptidase (prepilin peptidase) / N-methyltransferase